MLESHGSASGINPVAAITIESNQASSYYGFSVTGAGDINNDGYDDIAVGAYQYDNGQTNEGRVFIYHGSSSGISGIAAITLEPDQASAFFGVEVEGAGDVNADGFADVIIGSNGYNNPTVDEGAAFIYHGSSAGLNAVATTTLSSGQLSANMAHTVASAGDLNNDGYDDVMIGAIYYDDDQIDEGRVYFHLGSAAGISVAPYSTIEGNHPGSNYASAIAGPGDLNADGYDDAVVGAFTYANPLQNEGAAFVYYTFNCSAVPETCNSLDDNCNGLIDDGVVESISISAGGATTFCQGGTVLLSATYSGTAVQWKKNGTNIPGATSSTYSVNKSGNYTCITTSACGTATSNTIAVTVNKNPNATISAGGPTSFCAGGSVTLTEMAVAGCTYQWYKGAAPIGGATTTSYVATTAGNYKCRVTKTATGCYKNSNVIAVSVPCKEGEMFEMNMTTFSIYPNPNNGIFTIAANGLTEQVMIEICNSMGEIVYSNRLAAENETIRLDHISSGVYFIRLNDGNTYTEQKLMIEK